LVTWSIKAADFPAAFGGSLCSTAANRVGRRPNTESRLEPAAAYEALGGDAVSPLFDMALEAIEEAVYNSLL
jgi:L-aminopeptidase/D-esterase-like protein